MKGVFAFVSYFFLLEQEMTEARIEQKKVMHKPNLCYLPPLLEGTIFKATTSSLGV
jgi:hypothetical protein